MMRSVIVFLLLAAAIGLSMAQSDIDLLPSTETIEQKEAKEPACCNHCGICDRRPPEFARCQCGDLVRRCHPSCKRCVIAEVRPYPPLYRCLDMAYYDCHRNCNHATTTASQPIN